MPKNFIAGYCWDIYWHLSAPCPMCFPIVLTAVCRWCKPTFTSNLSALMASLWLLSKLMLLLMLLPDLVIIDVMKGIILGDKLLISRGVILVVHATSKKIQLAHAQLNGFSESWKKVLWHICGEAKKREKKSFKFSRFWKKNWKREIRLILGFELLLDKRLECRLDSVIIKHIMLIALWNESVKAALLRDCIMDRVGSLVTFLPRPILNSDSNR